MRNVKPDRALVQQRTETAHAKVRVFPSEDALLRILVGAVWSRSTLGLRHEGLPQVAMPGCMTRSQQNFQCRRLVKMRLDAVLGDSEQVRCPRRANDELAAFADDFDVRQPPGCRRSRHPVGGRAFTRTDDAGRAVGPSRRNASIAARISLRIREDMAPFGALDRWRATASPHDPVPTRKPALHLTDWHADARRMLTRPSSTAQRIAGDCRSQNPASRIAQHVDVRLGRREWQDDHRRSRRLWIEVDRAQHPDPSPPMPMRRLHGHSSAVATGSRASLGADGRGLSPRCRNPRES